LLHKKSLIRAHKKYKNSSIAKKLLAMILSVSIIPIILVELLMYTIGVSGMEEQTKALIVSKLKLSANSVENLLNRYDNIIRDVYTDDTFIQQVKLVNKWDRKDYYIAKNTILDKLRDLTYVNEDILGIAVIFKHQEIAYYDTITLSTKKSFLFDEYLSDHKELFNQAATEKDTIYSKVVYCEDEEYGQSNHIYIAHQLIDFNEYKAGAIGCVILCVSEETLRNTYYQEDGTDSDISILMNQDGDIISFPLTDYIGRNIYEMMNQESENIQLYDALSDFFIQEQFMENSRLEINYENIENGRFILANVQAVDYALEGVRQITEIIIIVSAIIIVVCIFLSLFFARSTNKKVQGIISVMKRADNGEYNMQIVMAGNDEFAQISSSFNQMIKKINESMEQERESMVREKNAEIRSLEAQINPHFLYNTLDAINWEAQDQEEYSIGKMITSLAEILRYSIHKSNGIVTLETELKYLKQYIYLQQRRFHYSFQCILDVEEELLEYKVHKLMLQPFIENAIEHAFPGKNERDEILIRIWGQAERIAFSIEDNGQGMSEEQVDYFNHYDYKEDIEHNSIGISNVITRIKLYYGDDGKFYMNSSANGTVIYFEIPCI